MQCPRPRQSYFLKWFLTVYIPRGQLNREGQIRCKWSKSQGWCCFLVPYRYRTLDPWQLLSHRFASCFSSHYYYFLTLISISKLLLMASLPSKLDNSETRWVLFFSILLVMLDQITIVFADFHLVYWQDMKLWWLIHSIFSNLSCLHIWSSLSW